MQVSGVAGRRRRAPLACVRRRSSVVRRSAAVSVGRAYPFKFMTSFRSSRQIRNGSGCSALRGAPAPGERLGTAKRDDRGEFAVRCAVQVLSKITQQCERKAISSSDVRRPLPWPHRADFRRPSPTLAWHDRGRRLSTARSRQRHEYAEADASLMSLAPTALEALKPSRAFPRGPPSLPSNDGCLCNHSRSTDYGAAPPVVNCAVYISAADHCGQRVPGVTLALHATPHTH